MNWRSFQKGFKSPIKNAVSLRQKLRSAFCNYTNDRNMCHGCISDCTYLSVMRLLNLSFLIKYLQLKQNNHGFRIS